MKQIMDTKKVAIELSIKTSASCFQVMDLLKTVNSNGKPIENVYVACELMNFGYSLAIAKEYVTTSSFTGNPADLEEAKTRAKVYQF